MDFPRGANSGGGGTPANAEDLRDRSLIPESGRSPGEGNGNPLQDSCLENPTDRGALGPAVDGVTKSWIQLKQLSNKKKETEHCTLFLK